MINVNSELEAENERLNAYIQMLNNKEDTYKRTTYPDERMHPSYPQPRAHVTMPIREMQENERVDYASQRPSHESDSKVMQSRIQILDRSLRSLEGGREPGIFL